MRFIILAAGMIRRERDASQSLCVGIPFAWGFSEITTRNLQEILHAFGARVPAADSQNREARLPNVGGSYITAEVPRLFPEGGRLIA